MHVVIPLISACMSLFQRFLIYFWDIASPPCESNANFKAIWTQAFQVHTFSSAQRRSPVDDSQGSVIYEDPSTPYAQKSKACSPQARQVAGRDAVEAECPTASCCRSDNHSQMLIEDGLVASVSSLHSICILCSQQPRVRNASGQRLTEHNPHTGQDQSRGFGTPGPQLGKKLVERKGEDINLGKGGHWQDMARR